MPDSVNEPEPVPVLEPVPAPASVPVREEARPRARRSGPVLLGLGIVIGLALGIFLTVGMSRTFSILAPTPLSPKESVEVFNELNELRQQINQLNDDKKAKDLDKADAIRQALSAITPKPEAADNGTPSVVMPNVVTPPKKQEAAAEPRPARNPNDPFAELDEEIERLEKTQKVLNTILDVFSRKGKEPAKER